MKIARKQFGMTLVETTVTVAIVSLLAVLATPSIRAYFNALGSPAEVKGAISAAFASARAIAAKEQHYAGVRFQQDPSGKQYMIFIIQDPAIGATFFRAVDGQKPIKLPDNIGVMDLMVRTDHSSPLDVNDREIVVGDLDDTNLTNLDADNRNIYVTDSTAFSIIFSPAGKLVIHDVRVRNRNNNSNSPDDVFNTQVNVTDPVNPVGMFYQDDYAGMGLGREVSRNNFVIYDKVEFKKMNNIQRYDYLFGLERVYTNPYTGTIIQGN